MPTLLARHGVTAILLAITLEELGVPMPIPTDLLIIVAGATVARSPFHAALLFGVILTASAVGASGLYELIRRGGRPLVDRFGRYVHLGPAQLDRAQAQLERHGWWAIAAGRTIPGLRYATVIACGLLGLPYWRFVTAHLVGSAVYIATFLGLGAAFGPRVLDHLHLPHLALRLLWLAVLALGLPLLCSLSARHAMRQAREPKLPEPAHLVSIGASAVGTMALAATWELLATLARQARLPEPLTAAYLLGARYLGGAARGLSGAVIGYLILLGLCWLVGILDDLVRARVHRWGGRHVLGRIGGLAVVGSVLIGAVLGAIALIVRPAADAPPAVPLLSGGVWLLLGMLSYAVTTVSIEILGALAARWRARPPVSPAEPPDPTEGRGRSDVSPAA